MDLVEVLERCRQLRHYRGSVAEVHAADECPVIQGAASVLLPWQSNQTPGALTRLSFRGFRWQSLPLSVPPQK